MSPRHSRRKRRSRPRQQELVFPMHGGVRDRAGRPTLFAQRMGPEHVTRASFRSKPVHVTMRMCFDVRASLRRGKLYDRTRTALRAARDHLRCRIVHYAIVGNHLHLIVEAGDHAALTAGMRGFAVRIARGVNSELGRKGPVFAFRYDARVLTNPLQMRNTLLYVLNNAKKHAAEQGRPLAHNRYWVDPCSSAAYFDGWKPECDIWIRPPDDGGKPTVARPELWLVTTGWRRHGLLDPGELPRYRAPGQPSRAGRDSAR